MATDTTIEWADKTWSPIIGCDRVSPGCDRCYAISTARIREHNPHPRIAAAFAGTTKRTDNGIDWSGQINLLEDRLTEPLRWRKPRKIFVNSLSDLFHMNVPAEYIARVFAVMAKTPQHTYQILTKRHGRMRSLLGTPIDGGQSLIEAAPDEETAQTLYDAIWPLPNVWLGVSVEDQKRADLRIPALLDTSAAVRFLSCEPLLGPVDLNNVDNMNVLDPGDTGHENGLHWVDGPTINWVIVGGESGPGARPMSPDWARTLRDQCATAKVPYLFKQWGAYQPTGYMVIGRPSDPRSVLVGDPIDDLGHRWEMRRVGKKAAGRELDGRTHDDFPEPARA